MSLVTLFVLQLWAACTVVMYNKITKPEDSRGFRLWALLCSLAFSPFSTVWVHAGRE